MVWFFWTSSPGTFVVPPLLLLAATGESLESKITVTDGGGDFVEPWIEKHNLFFSKEDCQSIIAEAEAFGFPNSSDSIDYGDEEGTVSWAIDVYQADRVEAPNIAKIYEKYMPNLIELVKEKKFEMNDGDTSEPSLDWVFLRKYEAGGDRHMLRLHNDVNLFTVNIALNDDFEGGGLFYHKNKQSYFMEDDPIPELPEELLTYDFLRTIVERKNATENGIVFPQLEQGDLMIHNYTLYHAIAPIQKGTRYSLVFFFDEEHEHVKAHLEHERVVVLTNMFDYEVDLYLVDRDSAKLTYMLVETDVPEEYGFDAITEDQFVVKNSATGKIVYRFEVPPFLEEDEEDEFYVEINSDYERALKEIEERGLDMSPSRIESFIDERLAYYAEEREIDEIEEDEEWIEDKEFYHEDEQDPESSYGEFDDDEFDEDEHWSQHVHEYSEEL